METITLLFVSNNNIFSPAYDLEPTERLRASQGGSRKVTAGLRDVSGGFNGVAGGLKGFLCISETF